MTHLPLSCPRCHKPLVYVPLDGFTLHYHCGDHGPIILRPLIVVEADDDGEAVPVQEHHTVSSSGAA